MIEYVFDTNSINKHTVLNGFVLINLFNNNDMAHQTMNVCMHAQTYTHIYMCRSENRSFIEVHKGHVWESSSSVSSLSNITGLSRSADECKNFRLAYCFNVSQYLLTNVVVVSPSYHINPV